MKKRLIFLSGPLALVCYALHDILGALNYPGYDPLTQAVSDLTADSAPSLWISQPLSRVFGAFSILCACAACVYLAKRVNRLQYSGVIVYAAMNAVSAVGYTLFPLTDAGLPDGFQNVMHIVVTVIVVAASVVSLVLMGVGGLLKCGGMGGVCAYAGGRGRLGRCAKGCVRRFRALLNVLCGSVYGVFRHTVYAGSDRKNARR